MKRGTADYAVRVHLSGKQGFMYRRAAHGTVAFLALAFFAGSAAAQALSGNQLVVNGNNMPNAIGGLPDSQVQLNLYGPFSPATGTAQGFRMGSNLSPGPGGDAYGFNIIPTLNKAGSGTHGNFIGMQVQPPVIGAGAASLTNAATVWITGAPTAATNNYALWVGQGNTELGGFLHVVGDAKI